jgi:putative PIG3 family NAD(P)H quinone oxidoreductase
MRENTVVTLTTEQGCALTQQPIAPPRFGEVQIHVAFAGVNRADVLQRMGLYPPPPDASPIMGLEVAGTVVAVGEGVEHWHVGDTACALVHGGGYATYVNARADHCLKPPARLSLQQAAALPEAALTVWHNLITLGQLQKGDITLIHGGASGIGSFGIQLAKARGATVITTVGTDAKAVAAHKLGADLVINYQTHALKDVLETHQYAGKIKVILDMAGGDFTPIHLDVIAPEGRIVCIGVMRGAKTTINLTTLFSKRLTLTGSTLRGLDVMSKAQGFREITAEVLPLIEAGAITPIVAAVVPLKDAQHAHDVMLSGEHVGKILLDCTHAH